MGYTNTTPQFGLPQYAPADTPQREDFNKAFKAISENMGKGGDVQSVNGKTGMVKLDADDVNAVNKAGDTMTGNLDIMSSGTVGYSAHGSDANMSIVISDNKNAIFYTGSNDGTKASQISINNEKKEVVFSTLNDVAWKNYQLFGEHNPLMELLWENASPQSAFLAQTISLDLSKYDRVRIDSRVSTSYAQILGAECRLNDGFFTLYIWGDSGKFSHRTGSTTINSVRFNNDQYNKEASDGSTCIPVRIYGIKGVG